MLVWKTWTKEKYVFGQLEEHKEYKMLLLFGFIPLFVSING